VRGAEALVRWQHPEHGLLGPARFVEAAERSGAIVRLGRWVLTEACRQAAAWWRELGPRAPYVSVNVSPVQLAEPGWVAEVMAVMDLTQLPPWQLQLEITEQAVVADLDRSAGRLRQLADRGVRIALDDFGAGFCHFGYLKRLPLHYLKLDRSMVEGIDENPRDLAVLRGILSMALALGLEVIAEGIERESQREAVVGEGCAAWQGFLGARPMTAIEFVNLTVS